MPAWIGTRLALVAEHEGGGAREGVRVNGRRALYDLDAHDRAALLLLEVRAAPIEVGKVAEVDVRVGAVRAERVELPAANEAETLDAERGAAPRDGAHIVLFADVEHDYMAGGPVARHERDAWSRRFARSGQGSTRWNNPRAQREREKTKRAGFGCRGQLGSRHAAYEALVGSQAMPRPPPRPGVGKAVTCAWA